MREIKVRHVSEYRKRTHCYPGTRKPSREITPEIIQEMVRLFNLGVSRTFIGRQLEISFGTVTKYLKQAGVKVPKKPKRERGGKSFYPYDGPRYRVARFCGVYALIDKHSPRFSRPELWIEEIIQESELCADLIVLAKQLDEAETKKSET